MTRQRNHCETVIISVLRRTHLRLAWTQKNHEVLELSCRHQLWSDENYWTFHHHWVDVLHIFFKCVVRVFCPLPLHLTSWFKNDSILMNWKPPDSPTTDEACLWKSASVMPALVFHSVGVCAMNFLSSYSYVFHSIVHNVKKDSCSSKLYIYTQCLSRYHDVIDVFSCHKVLICVINRCSQHESLSTVIISHSKTSLLQNMVLIL